jgi:hypothetical protein
MIKKWNQFIREFIESGSYINSKMQELKDLIDNVTEGQNIIYEWENKDDHQLSVSFSTDELSIKYDFDIDDLYVTKTANNNIDFETEVSSVDEGLEIIEKDVQSILNISESNEYIDDYEIGDEFLVVRDFAHNIRDRFENGKIKKDDRYKIADINTEFEGYPHMDPDDINYVEFKIIKTTSRRNDDDDKLWISINNFKKALKRGNIIKVN